MTTDKKSQALTESIGLNEQMSEELGTLKGKYQQLEESNQSKKLQKMDNLVNSLMV